MLRAESTTAETQPEVPEAGEAETQVMAESATAPSDLEAPDCLDDVVGEDAAVVQSQWHPVGLAETYIPDWTAEQALREVIQNWRDAIFAQAEESDTPYQLCRVFELRQQRSGISRYEAKYLDRNDEVLGSLTYDPKTGALVLANVGHLDRSHLHLGTGSKRSGAEKSSGIAGRHGEGMKACALVLSRYQMPMKVSHGDEAWTFSFQPSPVTQDQILHFMISDLRDQQLDGQVLVEIDNVAPELWEALRCLFLDITCHNIGAIDGEESDGFTPQLLCGSETHGKLFVKGIFVQDESVGAPTSAGPWGYNVNIDVDRDRRSVPHQWERYRKTSILHADVAKKCRNDTAHIKLIYQELERGNHSLYYFHEYASQEDIELLWDMWAQEHVNGAMPQTSPKMCAKIAAKLNELGLDSSFYIYAPCSHLLGCCLHRSQNYVSFDGQLTTLKQLETHNVTGEQQELIERVENFIVEHFEIRVSISFKDFPSLMQYSAFKDDITFIYLSMRILENGNVEEEIYSAAAMFLTKHLPHLLRKSYRESS